MEQQGTVPYSGVSLCPDLRPKQKCFRVQRYNQGRFQDEFHEHVPRHRMTVDRATEAIRALVIRFANVQGSVILQSLLTKRGTSPRAGNMLDVHVDYPEPGVLRKACGGDVIAWVDEVVDEVTFRQTGSDLTSDDAS